MHVNKLLLAVAILVGVTSWAGAEDKVDFWGTWGDGKAEVSTYDVQEVCYNELRSGQLVMIFVTEDVSRKTLIKAESDKIPSAERLPVLKLNTMLDFRTGVYDYNVMTSVFAPVEPYRGQPRLAATKVTFTAQEWCGHVFERISLTERQVERQVFSYFERDGEERSAIKLPTGPYFLEDNLPILIRELHGSFVDLSTTLHCQIMPSAWQRRQRSGGFEWLSGSIFKVQLKDSYLWKIQVGTRSIEYKTALLYPHQILSWSRSDGGSGQLVARERLPYWQYNKKADSNLREQLKYRF